MLWCYRKILFLTAAGLTVQCGKPATSAKSPVTAAVVQEDATSSLETTTDARYSELQGNWRSADCTKVDTGSAQQAKVFTKAHLITIIDTYSDLACSKLKERFFIVAAYKTGELISPNPWRAIDLSVTGLAASFSDATILKGLNAAKVCGFSDWTSGVPKDLTNLPCMTTTPLAIGLFKAPSDFNIYQISGGKLLLGKEDSAHDGLEAGHRPVALNDATTALTKQATADDAQNRLPVLLASSGIKAAAAEAASTLRTLKLAIPELPATATAAATSHLEVVLVPANPFKQTQVFQAQAVSAITTPAIAQDTYTVTVLQVDGTSTTPKASGSAQVVVTDSADQSLTIHLK